MVTITFVNLRNAVFLLPPPYFGVLIKGRRLADGVSPSLVLYLVWCSLSYDRLPLTDLIPLRIHGEIGGVCVFRSFRGYSVTIFIHL